MNHLTIPAGLNSHIVTHSQHIPINNTNQVISNEHFEQLYHVHNISSVSNTRKHKSKKTRGTKKI